MPRVVEELHRPYGDLALAEAGVSPHTPPMASPGLGGEPWGDAGIPETGVILRLYLARAMRQDMRGNPRKTCREAVAMRFRRVGRAATYPAFSAILGRQRVRDNAPLETYDDNGRPVT